mgnify:CR=1 FL=1
MISLNFLNLTITCYCFHFAIKDIILREELNIFINLLNIFYILIFSFSLFIFLKHYKLSTIEFNVLIFFCLLGFNYFTYSINLISFYLLLEFQSLCFYILTSYYKNNRYSFEAGLKYFIISSFSSTLILFGLSIMYGFLGINSFEEMNLLLINVNNLHLVYYFSAINFGLILILCGFFFKLYIFPFHFWVSDIYQGALFISTFFFSFFPLISFFYFLIKMYFLLYIFFYGNFFYIFYLSSILSMIIGSIGSIQQKKFRRLIAYSSINNIGYYIISFSFLDSIMIKNILFFILIYNLNIYNIFSFFNNLLLIKKKINLEKLSLLSEYIKYNKLGSILFLFLLFSIAGMPPFPTFTSKIFLFSYLNNNSILLLLFVIIITSIISFFYYLRIIKYVYYNISLEWFYILNYHYISGFLIIFFKILNINIFFYSNIIFTLIESSINF